MVCIMTKSNKIVFGVFLAAFFVIFAVVSMTNVFADTSDDVTLDVNVTETSAITILPTTLNWSAIGSGAAGGIRPSFRPNEWGYSRD